MRTVTLDILKDEGFDLLKDMEALKIIRLRSENDDVDKPTVKLSTRYSGAMSKQPQDEIDQQLKELRN